MSPMWARTDLMSACPELNGWTFMNYPQEEAEAMLAAMADQHKAEQASPNSYQTEFQEICTGDTVDFVEQAAGLLNEEDNTNSSFFNTFHTLFAEEHDHKALYLIKRCSEQYCFRHRLYTNCRWQNLDKPHYIIHE